jgi:hypothetical protein
LTTDNADIGEIEVDFIDSPDPLLNSLGVKGLGEVSMVGVAPAIVNALFHATGKQAAPTAGSPGGPALSWALFMGLATRSSPVPPTGDDPAPLPTSPVIEVHHTALTNHSQPTYAFLSGQSAVLV